MCFNPQNHLKMPSVKATLSPGVWARQFEEDERGIKRTDGHPVLTAMKPKIPDPVAPPAPPQQAKAPNTAPLRRRNAGGVAVPSGSTLLSGPSGIAASQLNLGSQTLLGGGGG